MNDNKHYYAFVSHSSKDAKVAMWLRDKLVNYNIPASVQREQRAPKRLRPVFIYQTDLAGANLQDALQQELNDSQWLIVICSPAGAKSQYVNGEVEHFIDSGCANRIIPFIVGGTPHAKDPEDECFPPALLQLAEDGTELRGVNLAECQKQLGSKMGAVVNVVATMLGVRFDSMWNVYRRKQRRHLLIAAACALLICLAGLFTWNYLRPTYKYYADYVDKWGVPEGVIELTKEQKSHRHRMYQFEYRRIPFGEPNAWQWRVVKVSYVNSANVPQRHHTLLGWYTEILGQNRSAIVEIKYTRQNGTPLQWIFCDEKGKTILRHALSERNGKQAVIADFVSAQETKGVGFSEEFGVSGLIPNSPNVARYAYERDKNGYITKLTYHSNNDYNLSRSATAGHHNAYGFAYTLDSLGRPLRVMFIDKNGRPMSDKRNLAGQTFEYDSKGIMSNITHININGNPTWYHSLSYLVRTTNADGNIVELAFFDPQGNPCLDDEESSLSKELMKYDERGNIVETSALTTDGLPCQCSSGGFTYRCKYDRYGRVVEETYYNQDGQLFSYWLGAKRTCKYDKNGNCIEEATYGTDGKLLGVWIGIAVFRNKYDKDGNQIERAFFGEDDKPIINKYMQCHKFTYKYDSNGNRLEEVCYGVDGKLCMNSEKYARWCRKYDDRGNKIESSFFDTIGNLCLWKEGFAIQRWEYDDRGRETETSYFGADDQPCCPNGYFKEKTEYDDQHALTITSYYDINDRLCLNGENISKKIEYDNGKGYSECSYYDIDGKPCMNNEGYAKYTELRTELGFELEKAYYGLDGRPCIPTTEMFHRRTIKYDKYWNDTEYAHYGTDNQLCLMEWGVAKWITVYNEYGQPVERTYYGTDDKPCMTNNGFSKYVKKYENNHITEASYYDTAGKLCMITDDEIGKQYARKTFLYDHNNIKTADILYDTHGKVVGEINYDTEGNVVE